MNEKYVCISCNQEHSMDLPIWRCSCLGLLKLEYDLGSGDIDKTQNHPLQRYKHWLPDISPCKFLSFGETVTTMYPFEYEGQQVYVKNEFLFPSGSYKDRGSMLLMPYLCGNNIQSFVEDSSGNAGASLAAYAARYGVEAHIYAPSKLFAPKLSQIMAYGANLYSIRGSREETARAAMQATAQYFYASHVYQPLFNIGIQTLAYEWFEQMADLSNAVILLPVGNGSLLIGVMQGFHFLLKNGLISQIPKIIAVQSENVSPLFRAFENLPSKTYEPTVAEGIGANNPARLQEMLKGIQQSGGYVLNVSEDEIKIHTLKLWQMGFFVEHTSAVPFAALKNLRQEDKDKTLYTIFSSTGLKTVQKVSESIPIA